jgi:hypothetical protein
LDEHELPAAEAAPASTPEPAISHEIGASEEQVKSLTAERDRLAAALDAATLRANAAEAEIVKLRGAAAAASAADLLALLWALISQQTKAGIAWLRAKIPANHPALPWFDWTVETATKLGCEALRLATAFVKWATPHVKALTEKLIAETKAQLSKK